MSRTAELQRRFEAAFMPNYGVPPVALMRGEGCQVWDADGNQYTDLSRASRSARLATPTPRSPGQ